MKRRLFSILLALCMTLAMLPAAAFAKSVSFNGEIIIENNRWEFMGDETVGYYVPGKSGKFKANQPDSGSFLKVTKTGENEITITVHGNVNISVNKSDTIKSIKNLIITGATGKDTLSLSTTKDGTAISVLGDLTVTGITLTVTAGNGPALWANNITVSDATLIATNNSADSAAIQATQGDGPLGNLTVSGASAITVTNNNATGRAIHATIINSNETPGQTDASQVTISSPALHSHVCSDGWTSDATGHWHRCADANCTEKLNFAAHSGGTATCTEAKKCEVCGQSYSEPDPNNHTHLSDWKFDETGHWKTCSACSTDIEKTAHTYSEWQITQKATAAEAGAKCRECSVCHYKETAAIPPVPCTHEGSTTWEPAGDGVHHVKKCADCGAIIEKAAHSGGAATCNAKKKCEVCGEPYGELDTNIHTALSGWIFDETGHWKTCNDCNTDIEKTAHSGGTATCTEAKRCEVCGEPYGELNPSNHTALSDWASDETGHWKTCMDCKTDIEKTAHTYSEWQITQKATAAEAGAKCRECSVCHYKETAAIPPVPCTHEGSTTWEPANDGEHHVKKCTDCGAIIEKAAHSGGTATCTAKKKCTICGEPYGELDANNHTSLSGWASDETHHWKTCSACNTDIEKTSHTGGTATCIAKKKCEVCGQSYGELNPSNHTHLSDWKFDETGHWKTCNDCGAIIEKVAHSGGTATCIAKKKCEVCSEPYGELDTNIHTALSGWASDETHHWKDCADCKAADIDKTAHTGGTATCTEAKRCEVCDQSYGEPSPSNHTALSDWIFDETGHWKVCADCKAADIDKSAHTLGEWVIDKEATATETGSRHKVCTICNYETQTETIPATVPCTHEGSTWVPADDGVHHVKKCTVCGAEPAIEKHNFSYRDNGDNSHTMTCNICGETCIKPHDFSHKTVPVNDRKHHGECICGAFDAAEDHTYQNGKCTACGAAAPAPVEPTPGGSGIIITPEAADPVFLSGANQTVAVGSAAVFRIDYSYAAFRSVAVDGVILDPADYTTWEGSTWVKLTAACTKSLVPGTHTLSVYFDGATAATTFTVGGQPNPATGARDAVGIAAAAAVIALLGSAAVLRKK